MTFTFTDQQVQYIINVLSQRPLGEAIELFNEIQRQAGQQQIDARNTRTGPQLVGETQQAAA